MSIFTSRKFLPLFVTQFLGAFNDNLFKNALVVLVTYKLADRAALDIPTLVTIAAGIFILPFFLFSATAGQLADKYDRGRMARAVKLAEIGIMLIAFAGFMMPSIIVLMIALFLMGCHSAFFGPVKYAILPQHLDGGDLLRGNAYVGAGTFLSILFGTIAGGLLVMHDNGPLYISVAVVVVAALGFIASQFIPAAPAPVPDMQVNANIWQETLRIMRVTTARTNIRRAVLAISWFWLVGATYLAQFPAFSKDFLGGDETVVTLLLTLFSVGIGLGSVLCNRLLKGQVQATYVPLAAILMAAFGVDLYFATRGGIAHEGLLTAAEFLSDAANWRIVADLFMIAVAGGLFVVPLYAYVQKQGDETMMARMIAGLNIMNALFMVGSSVLAVIMLQISFTIPEIFLVMALMNIVVACYIVQLLPDALFRSIARTIFGWAYRVEVQGLENFEAAGRRVLIVANHASFLDAALIAAYLPVKITFAINARIARAWWVRPVLKFVDAFPVEPTNPMAVKSMVEMVRTDKVAMIFPEGRITVTGSLMKVYEGPGLIADKAQARILPIRIDGVQYTRFSRLRGKMPIRRFPKVTITIMPPQDFSLPEGVVGRQRRQLAAAQLYDMMSGMMFDSSDLDRTLMQSLLDARRTYGGGHLIAEDPERQPQSYTRFIAGALTMGRLLARHAQKGEAEDVPAVGVMLPNMVGTAVTFFALQSMSLVPAMLNFSAGPAQIASACQTARLRTVVTARRFVERGNLAPVIRALEDQSIHILYLEDLRAQAGIFDKAYALLARAMPGLLQALRKSAQAEDAAVILFTSGSEGTPKGVVLSHRNIQANRHQIASRVDFGPTDIVFNCLPMFHSFGLTGGTLLPILAGLRSFYYPSPLHYRIVPELIYDTNATILFGTDTFLTGYARYAHPYDFHAIRYVFAGAEKLREETRKTYAEKYGVRIFEGYGATETAPVISINTPMHNRPGSVGRLMPGMEHRLEPVEGVTPADPTHEVGKLVISGPNIMKGYFKSDAPGVLQPPEGGWYDTGDIVSRDAQGFISIQGRLKRFAKIAGEMVSLGAVEAAVQNLAPQDNHAVVSVKDEKKGERLVLFTTADLQADVVTAHFKAEGLSELSIPRKIVRLADIPLLATGKTDYQSLKAQAEA